MLKIAHISDLHVSGHNYMKPWGENLITLLEDMGPDYVIVTGDLTDDGYLYEYELAHYFLQKIKFTTFVVPGNHDARNEGYQLFEEFFGTRFPSFENEKIVLLGIDSTEPDIDDGHVGRENYPLIKEKLGPSQKFKIMCLHHHLLPIPYTGRERNIPVDAGDVLKICIEERVNCVLSGHKHYPWIWKLENTFFITAGTATSRRLKGFSYPSFNLLHVAEDALTIDIVNVHEKKVQETKKYSLV
ncbi:metallophosphoesterase family protein [Thermodesulfatator autotrophicus]|uniref:Metallophosphoesterase n=1 Tax=Thermodesulfatator autotrophicus TaxID=1795632 RepID=A0A177E8K8_9BACT|nr:metallophosphoesterase [Thermodesulfatator autotrophicus]OAG28036.1 metallophosphoesterase [Thermodesulfatator autotrophicus]